MVNRISTGLISLAAGVLLILIPNFILPVCEFALPAEPSGHLGHAADHWSAPVEEHALPPALPATEGHSGQGHMVCFYTAQAELGLGAVVIFNGLLFLLFSSPQRRLGVSLSLTGSAVLSGAIPTLLIGVCPGDMMICHSGTLPALLIVSAALALFSLVNALYLGKKAAADA
jgi:hypothetical protein